MANFNNPNLPGMMHQGFMNSPSSTQNMGHQHNGPGPGFNTMNSQQMNVSTQGMQQYQHSLPQQSSGMTGMSSSNFNQMSHASSMNSQQHHQNSSSALMPSGPRPGTPVSSSDGSVNTSNSQSLQQSQQQQQQSQQQQQQTKELNAASLCRFGQETVQEIISRTQEVFQTLRAAQPPDGKPSPGMDRKPKFQETLRTIRALFKRLRVIYEKIEESFPSSEDTYFEDSIPFKDGNEVTVLDDKKNTEAYRLAVEEYRDIIDQVALRNRHLKETVDHLRQIIWDINTMLAMRKE